MIDQEISAKYSIVPYGQYGMEVQRFGWQIAVFAGCMIREVNWQNAVDWCEQYYALIDAGPPGMMRGYQHKFDLIGYRFCFSPMRRCWILEHKKLKTVIELFTQDDVNTVIKELL